MVELYVESVLHDDKFDGTIAVSGLLILFTLLLLSSTLYCI